jgi:hypothetical protein
MGRSPMKTQWLLILAVLGVIGCRPAMDKEKVLNGRLLEIEYRMQAQYLTKGPGEARAALEKYLSEVAEIRLATDDTDAIEVFHRNRALAMARLEFLIASQEGRVPDLRGAILEMRKVCEEYAALSNEKLGGNLVYIIKGDAQAVSWLHDFDALSSRAMAAIKSGKHEDGTGHTANP